MTYDIWHDDYLLLLHNTYTYNIDNTFLVLGQLLYSSIMWYISIYMLFGYDQSLSIINYIYIDILIKQSIDIHIAFKFPAATRFIVFNMYDILWANIRTSKHVQLRKHSKNSGAYGEEVVKKNIHSYWYCPKIYRWATVLIQLTFTHLPSNDNQLHIYTLYNTLDLSNHVLHYHVPEYTYVNVVAIYIV